MITLDLVIIGIGLVCAIELGVLLQRSEYLAKTLGMQMTGLGQTYLQGLEVVTLSLERLEKRVKAIEEEVS